MIKGYLASHYTLITNIKTTLDCKYLFSVDNEGFMKQFSLEEQKLVKDYRKIHGQEVTVLQMTPNGKFVITCDYNGYCKQWLIKEKTIYKNYGLIHKDGVTCLVIDYFGLNMFTGDSCGRLKQWNWSEEQQNFLQSYDYGIVNYREKAIVSIGCTKDGGYVFTCDELGELKHVDSLNKRLYRDCGFIMGKRKGKRRGNPFTILIKDY